MYLMRRQMRLFYPPFLRRPERFLPECAPTLSPIRFPGKQLIHPEFGTMQVLAGIPQWPASYDLKQISERRRIWYRSLRQSNRGFIAVKAPGNRLPKSGFMHSNCIYRLFITNWRDYIRYYFHILVAFFDFLLYYNFWTGSVCPFTASLCTW